MQLAQYFNWGERPSIMCAFQSVLKRTPQKVRDEVAAQKVLGYCLGVKLVRGAYIKEERYLAEKFGYESPCWDDIESTHKSYNGNMTYVMQNLDEKGMMLCGTHNHDSVALFKKNVQEMKTGRSDFIKSRLKLILASTKKLSHQGQIYNQTMCRFGISNLKSL